MYGKFLPIKLTMEISCIEELPVFRVCIDEAAAAAAFSRFSMPQVVERRQGKCLTEGGWYVPQTLPLF